MFVSARHQPPLSMLSTLPETDHNREGRTSLRDDLVPLVREIRDSDWRCTVFRHLNDWFGRYLMEEMVEWEDVLVVYINQDGASRSLRVGCCLDISQLRERMAVSIDNWRKEVRADGPISRSPRGKGVPGSEWSSFRALSTWAVGRGP